MVVQATEFEGVFLIDNFSAEDERGLFVKTFNDKSFKDFVLDFQIRESYYSVSKRDVIRGMHFQLPPLDHEKLVFVMQGAILDVVLDLRKNSATFGECMGVELSEENRQAIFLPKGVAHGFKSLKNNTITVYNVSSIYDAEHDRGVLYNSFGFDWELEHPILSNRDLSFPTLGDFSEVNPF
jgi:dTDP-4-dehydrorhamnose 3,5-epimerase